MKYKLAETDIYDFAGWLTTREGVMKVGSSSDASPMADAVGEYIKKFPNRFSSPPQRPWVGLTDMEVQNIVYCRSPNIANLRKAEQLLKDKNT